MAQELQVQVQLHVGRRCGQSLNSEFRADPSSQYPQMNWPKSNASRQRKHAGISKRRLQELLEMLQNHLNQ